nr:YcaO-like family protein [Microlunatus panaciterrae]
MRPHLARLGVTRLANVTGLDRLGIPVYHAICPRSADSISVYAGKGRTVVDACVSAVMEAAERFCAAAQPPAAVVASLADLLADGRHLLDPRDHTIELHPDFTVDTPIAWTRGVDLLNERAVLVPQYLAGYYLHYDGLPTNPIATSNGLASGNSLEEAVLHGLCEVVERDAWTIADVLGHRLPRSLGVAGGDIADRMSARYPLVDLDSLPEAAQELADAFLSNDVRLTVRSITSPVGVPTVLATATEEHLDQMSRSHHGIGTHPDPQVALTRALTEAAQSRAGDIAAIREDLTLPGEKVQRWLLHTQRSGSADTSSWATGADEHPVRLDDLPAFATDDVRLDIDRLLERLRDSGLDRAIVVDLSPADLPIAVCRVLVPGAESWSVDRSRIGPRVTALWNEALVGLTGDEPRAAAG